MYKFQWILFNEDFNEFCSRTLLGLGFLVIMKSRLLDLRSRLESVRKRVMQKVILHLSQYSVFNIWYSMIRMINVIKYIHLSDLGPCIYRITWVFMFMGLD